jgi:hypothetical protein
VQLLVVPPEDQVKGRLSEKARAVWSQVGRAQILIEATRRGRRDAADWSTAEEVRFYALAVIATTPSSLQSDVALLEAELRQMQGALASRGAVAVAPYWSGRECIVAFEDVRAAVEVALDLRHLGLRVGAHYGVGLKVRDPFSGLERVAPVLAEPAIAASASAFAGTFYATEDFAAAAAALAPNLAVMEFVGELEPRDDGPPVGLYAFEQPLDDHAL